MEAVAVLPGKPNSIRVAELPEPPATRSGTLTSRMLPCPPRCLSVRL